MTDGTEYEPIDCPVSDCAYRDAIRSVAGHVSGTHDDAHSWDRLGYDGARDFVMTEKRRQNGDLETEGRTAERTDDDSEDDSAFELGFEREALVLMHLASEYDLESLDDLGVGQLADLYSLLADLKNSADEARKDVRDALQEELREDREFTSALGSVRRYSYESRRLKDEEAVADAVESADVDPEAVRSFDKKKLKRAVEDGEIDAEAVFDFEERVQIQRAGANDERRDQRLERLDPDVRSLADSE